MLVIRLFRVGKKNQPSFKIVVTDKKNPSRSGRFLESVGSYTPITKEKKLKGDRIKYWLSVGAKPSPTVYNLLVSEKIIEGKKIPVHPVRKSKNQGETKSQASVSIEPMKEEIPLESEFSNGVNKKSKKAMGVTVAAVAVEVVPTETPAAVPIVGKVPVAAPEKPADEKPTEAPTETPKEPAPTSAEASAFDKSASFALRRQSYGASATEVATKAESADKSAGKEPPKEAKNH